MSLIDILPIAVLGALLGMDVVTFPQAMISRPIVAATAAGAFIGNAPAGLVMGVVLELLALEMLPFGASKYPEWGSASVIGGSLFAAQATDSGGALPASLFASLVAAMVSGWSMVRLRKLNASVAAREREELARGSRRAVVGLQLFGLTGDFIRGLLLTFGAMVVFSPLVRGIVGRWQTDPLVSRSVVIAIVVAVSASAVWRVFHGVARAHLLFLAGLVIGGSLLVAV
ncbi:MAG TPA: PTS sugar transporter subunit IIC [Gemmatimonadaceae bacterium]|nr:PTS sugar transporter subunit IIC [Gemmatimonadaceae bacterium]